LLLVLVLVLVLLFCSLGYLSGAWLKKVRKRIV